MDEASLQAECLGFEWNVVRWKSLRATLAVRAGDVRGARPG